jgi:hypothetical protein
MFLLELFDPKLSYHHTLNPKLWSVGKGNVPVIDPKVEEHLVAIAEDFIESLELPQRVIKDYVLTGSNANYNWTELSDIDVHVLVDYAELKKGKHTCCVDPASCLLAKKTVWNDHHDVEIRGHPVEVYASDSTDKLVDDSGCYSIKNHQWIKEPSWRSLKIDSTVISAKAQELINDIDEVVDSKTVNKETIKRITDKLWKYRQAGLSKGGEMSIENLVFKALRNNGYIDKIRKYALKADDEKLSLR